MLHEIQTNQTQKKLISEEQGHALQFDRRAPTLNPYWLLLFFYKSQNHVSFFLILFCRYNNLNIDTILASNRLVTNYVDCLLSRKPCPPEGKDLKSKLFSALFSRGQFNKSSSQTKRYYTINHRLFNNRVVEILYEDEDLLIKIRLCVRVRLASIYSLLTFNWP